MHLDLAYLARDRIADHDRDARRSRLAAAVAPGPRRDRAASLRRATARGLAHVSRVSAAAVRRLDACIADDLERPRVRLDGI